MVRVYSGIDAFDRESRRLAEQGWKVSNTVERRPRAGCGRIVTLGLFALVFPPKPELVVTYERTGYRGPSSLAERISDSESPEETDPTAARFGSLRSDFDSRYGDPVETAEFPNEDDTVLATYEIQGFGEVKAIFYDDTMSGLVLRPIPGETWTEAQAATVLDDFKPQDADFEDERVDMGASSDGTPSFAIEGYSEGLSEYFDSSVYRHFEAEGRPGHFFVQYMVVSPGRFEGISFNLGLARGRE